MKKSGHTFSSLMALLEASPAGYITVERKSPVFYGGQEVAGQCARIMRPMTRNEFGERYGGEKYVLTYWGLPKGASRTQDHTDRPIFKARASLVVMISGPPLLTSDVGARVPDPLLKNADARIYEAPPPRDPIMEIGRRVRARTEQFDRLTAQHQEELANLRAECEQRVNTARDSALLDAMSAILAIRREH